MSIRAGQLRHSIEIQRRHTATDNMSDASEEWVTVVKPVAASIEPLSGRELYASQQHNSEITVRIRIRYRPGITADMRVVHGGVIYPIVYPPINPNMKNAELHLMCSAGLHAG